MCTKAQTVASACRGTDYILRERTWRARLFTVTHRRCIIASHFYHTDRQVRRSLDATNAIAVPVVHPACMWPQARQKSAAEKFCVSRTQCVAHNHKHQAQPYNTRAGTVTAAHRSAHQMLQIRDVSSATETLNAI
jgi:hypothetical protein